jgi:uncharacterized protein DUF1479
MDRTRRFLNRLWNATRADGTPEFDPDRQCNYADRLRRREPGDTSLGSRLIATAGRSSAGAIRPFIASIMTYCSVRSTLTILSGQKGALRPTRFRLRQFAAGFALFRGGRR